MQSKKRSIRLSALFALFSVTLLTTSKYTVAQEEIVLHSFLNNGQDGQTPSNPLIFDGAGNLYSTTEGGGAYNSGTIFEMSPNAGGGWTENPLYSFPDNGTYSEGLNASGGLILDGLGNLYGMTSEGGMGRACFLGPGCGTVFTLSPKAGGVWAYKILHYFNDNGGNGPGGGLVFDADDNLYGVTAFGGSTNAEGTAFELSPAGNGKWTESLLREFHPGLYGIVPGGPLIFDADGNLYGTSASGGTDSRGTVFELSPAGEVGWMETVLYSFVENSGFTPNGGLVFDANGNLYGTTAIGGANCAYIYSCGTLFELSPAGDGSWTETTIHSFSQTATDGFDPNGGLIIDSSGNLYGTTAKGAAYNGGIVFELTPTASGNWTETVLHSFGRAKDGKSPRSSLVFDSSGNLYGTTAEGGLDGVGTVFEITP
jgi:uncharacterized repeat protein (TIGR03803 family)